MFQKKAGRRWTWKSPNGVTKTEIGQIKGLKKVRRTQILGQDRLITLLDKQGRVIRDQDKVIDRIEAFNTELYDSEQYTIIHTDPQEVPGMTSWEVEAALGDTTATGNDHINIETLKAGEGTISKTIAKL